MREKWGILARKLQGVTEVRERSATEDTCDCLNISLVTFAFCSASNEYLRSHVQGASYPGKQLSNDHFR